MRVLPTLIALEAPGRFGSRTLGTLLLLGGRLLSLLLVLWRMRILLWVLVLLATARRHRPLLHGDGHGWVLGVRLSGGPWLMLRANVVGAQAKLGRFFQGILMLMLLLGAVWCSVRVDRVCGGECAGCGVVCEPARADAGDL